MLGELSGLASHWVNVGLIVGMSGVGIRVPLFMNFLAAPVPRSAMTATLASVPAEGAGEVDAPRGTCRLEMPGRLGDDRRGFGA